MNKLLFLIAFMLVVQVSSGQKGKMVNLSGEIIEEESQKAISFASIHIKGQEIGTISDSLGRFSFEFEKEFINDSVIVSCVGYKRYEEKISNLKLRSPLKIELQDSLFMLDEVIAICYNHIEPHIWSAKNGKKNKLMLSFATRKMETAVNFVKVIKEKHGKYKEKAGTCSWTKVKIKGFEEKKVKLTLVTFACTYCPLDNAYIVALDIKDFGNNNLLENEEYKKFFIDYFQELLDLSLGQGIDFEELEFRNNRAFKKDEEVTYTGKAFSYYDKGQKGKIGEFKDGLNEGLWIWWFENGQKGKEVFFEAGEMAGTGTWWFPNGQLKRVSEFKNGKKDGKTVMYFPDGTKNFEGYYLNDNMHGMCIWWYESGEKKKESIYDKGVFKSKTEWDKNGNIIEKVTFN